MCGEDKTVIQIMNGDVGSSHKHNSNAWTGLDILNPMHFYDNINGSVSLMYGGINGLNDSEDVDLRYLSAQVPDYQSQDGNTAGYVVGGDSLEHTVSQSVTTYFPGPVNSEYSLLAQAEDVYA